MNRSIDLARLRSTLGSPEITRLVDALQRRLELGRPLTGILTLSAASAAERDAVDTLLGRKSTRGASLQIDLDFLLLTLREARICDDLDTAVEALRGSVTDRRVLASERAAAWSALWRGVADRFDGQPALQLWLARLEGLGTLKRLCNDNPVTAGALMEEIARIVNALPATAEPLPSFSARLFGDAHALDPGTVRATLAVRAVARLGGIQLVDDAESRRAAWASMGVMCDELSTPALVLNLPASVETPLGQLLRAASLSGEPIHVSLRLLLRYSLGSEPLLRGRDVFVCENPTIVALATARLGHGCAPLVCVNGQFATPALVLMRQLRNAGARLHYHGDFDPSGLVIARRVMAESGAQAWRFGVADYLTAPKSVKFVGSPGATPWDPPLQDAMRADGHMVHEEAVFDALVVDLTRKSEVSPSTM